MSLSARIAFLQCVKFEVKALDAFCSNIRSLASNEVSYVAQDGIVCSLTT